MQDKCNNTEGEAVCPTCKHKISDPLSLRCPRCYTLLLKTGCSGACNKCGGKKTVAVGIDIDNNFTNKI